VRKKTIVKTKDDVPVIKGMIIHRVVRKCGYPYTPQVRSSKVICVHGRLIFIEGRNGCKPEQCYASRNLAEKAALNLPVYRLIKGDPK
jgi:hypothetical protein